MATGAAIGLLWRASRRGPVGSISLPPLRLLRLRRLELDRRGNSVCKRAQAFTLHPNRDDTSIESAAVWILLGDRSQHMAISRFCRGVLSTDCRLAPHGSR